MRLVNFKIIINECQIYCFVIVEAVDSTNTSAIVTFVMKMVVFVALFLFSFHFWSIAFAICAVNWLGYCLNFGV